jgi:hypothetical protein
VAYGRVLHRSYVVDRTIAAPAKSKGEEVLKIRVRPYLAHVLVAGLAALVLFGGLLETSAPSSGASAAGSPSSNVAVVPGFAPPPYKGNSGVPPLPVNVPELAKYHFTQLPVNQVTTAALQNYDTVILYGILWSDVPSSAQTAINSFAAKHKVVIWDADGTGSQVYSSFVHPFSTLSSGQGFQGKPSDSVVSFPTGVDFLASSNTASPYFLDPIQLVHDKDELNDMNAMKTATSNWRPALLAANHGIPGGAWPIAWSYGVIGSHTGLTIYSGLDADAFPTQEKMNNDRKELALDLAAPFSSTPASCTPHCGLPSVGSSHPFASCGFAKVPRHWVHGRVPVILKTSLASGITARIVTRSGRVLARGSEKTGDLVPLAIPTKKLPANRTSQLRAQVFVNGQNACTNRFQFVKANHTRPTLLLLGTSQGTRRLLTMRVSEASFMKVVARHVHWRTNRVPAGKVVQFHLPGSVRKATLILHDRAGHTVIRKLAWR